MVGWVSFLIYLRLNCGRFTVFLPKVIKILVNPERPFPPGARVWSVVSSVSSLPPTPHPSPISTVQSTDILLFEQACS